MNNNNNLEARKQLEDKFNERINSIRWYGAERIEPFGSERKESIGSFFIDPHDWDITTNNIYIPVFTQLMTLGYDMEQVRDQTKNDLYEKSMC